MQGTSARTHEPFEIAEDETHADCSIARAASAAPAAWFKRRSGKFGIEAPGHLDGKRRTRRRATLTRSLPSPLLFSRPRNALATNSLQEPVRSCFSGVGKALYGPRSRDQLQPSQGTKRTQFPSRPARPPGRSTPGTKQTQFPSRRGRSPGRSTRGTKQTQTLSGRDRLPRNSTRGTKQTQIPSRPARFPGRSTCGAKQSQFPRNPLRRQPLLPCPGAHWAVPPGQAWSLTPPPKMFNCIDG